MQYKKIKRKSRGDTATLEKLRRKVLYQKNNAISNAIAEIFKIYLTYNENKKNSKYWYFNI